MLLYGIIRNFRQTLILAFQREVSARYYDMFPHGEQLYLVFKINIAKYNHSQINTVFCFNIIIFLSVTTMQSFHACFIHLELRLFFLFFFLETDTNSILKHYINSVFVVLNLLLTKKPYRILHFYIPVIFSVIYILFSLVYQKGFNQNAIYSALDWNNVPNVFLYVFGLPLVFLPLLTLLLYTLTVIRDAIGNLCEKNIGQTDRPVTID